MTTTTTTSTAEWSHEAIAPSTGLFDGDLSGDELMDIYNAVVGEGCDIVNATDELPALLLPQITEGGDVAELLATPEEVMSGHCVAAPDQSDNETGMKRVVSAGEYTCDVPPAKKHCPSGPGQHTNSTHHVVPGSPTSIKSTSNTPNPLNAPSVPIVTPQPSVQVRSDSVLQSDSPAVVSAMTAVPVPTLSNSSASTNSSAQNKTTEADFKSVAQAAVSNLISNVGAAAAAKNKQAHATSSGDNSNTVDTSTAHIKALTGNNWVAACSGGSGSCGGGSSADSTSAEAQAANNNRTQRQNLTPDERARQNRDRNREHARNTRLRKKAYVEELKRTLTELVAQRDAAELEKRRTAQREVEQREVRFRVLEEFLKLRGRNELNAARWAAILEDGFSLTLPVTGFRNMVHIDNHHDGIILEQILSGVNEVMSDSSYFASFLQSISGSTSDQQLPVQLVYHCDRKNFFMDGSNAVMDWTASSVGAVKAGARVELSMRGVVKAKFSPASNKLLSANIIFDTGLVSSQVALMCSQPSTTVSDEIATAAAVAAQQVASNQADAILESLEMPKIDSGLATPAQVPSAVMITHSVSAASVTSSEKGDNSSDESACDASSILHE